MKARLKKLFFLVVPFMAIFLLAPSAFAKKHKHCNPRYGQSYYDRSYYDRPYYDSSYYGRGRYDNRYYDRYDDDYYRRRTYASHPLMMVTMAVLTTLRPVTSLGGIF